MLDPLTVIFLWGLVVLVLFRQCTPSVALCASMLGGYLFLPHGTVFNLPVLPAIEKNSMTAFAAVLGLFLFARKKPASPDIQPGILPRDTMIRVLLVMLFGGIFMTILTNGDRLYYGSNVLPALGLYGAFSNMQSTIVFMLPALLARKYLATPDMQKLLLISLCIAGTAYILPILFEVRMSPQLNNIVYGYFPHSWIQHLRDGGWRPIVFMNHGLWVSIMMSISVLATLGCARIATPQRRVFLLGLAFVLLVTLALTKSLGALLITLVIGPIALFGTARLQMLFASAVLIFVLSYPMIRSVQIVQIERVGEFVGQFSFAERRVGSLMFRLTNEEEVLEKLTSRPVFGWGGWGRGVNYDEDGKFLNVLDSLWIIQLAEKGWVGYVSFFGLMMAPVLLLTFRKRRYEVTMVTSALCLVLTANMVDMLVNATLTPVTWLVIGSLIGRLEVLRGAATTETGQDVARKPLRPKLQYSRPRPEHSRPPGPATPQPLAHQRPMRSAKL